MALGTMTPVGPPRAGYATSGRRVRVFDVILTNGASYTTGGETISPTAAGMKLRIEQVQSTGQARTTSGGAATIPVSVDFATTPGSVKLQMYVAATGAEQAASANLSTFSIRLTFVGQ